jgi:hypothetical protein
MQERQDWIELIGELPATGYLMYGRQKLTFEENQSQGYRRVERLKYPYRAEKAERFYPGLIRVYDSQNPEIIEQNMKARLLRERDKWTAFLALPPEEAEKSAAPAITAPVVTAPVVGPDKDDETDSEDLTEDEIKDMERPKLVEELTARGFEFPSNMGTEKLKVRLRAAIKAEAEALKA